MDSRNRDTVFKTKDLFCLSGTYIVDCRILICFSFVQRHITVQQHGVLPPLQKCVQCCDEYHCPFCAPDKFKPTKHSVCLSHLLMHKKKAVRHKGLYDFSTATLCSLCVWLTHGTTIKTKVAGHFKTNPQQNIYLPLFINV